MPGTLSCASYTASTTGARKPSASTTFWNSPSVSSARPKKIWFGVGLARLLELRDELGRAHDRPRDQMREEGHEQRVVEEAARRLRAPQVDVERVGQGRERVEADADRQDDVPTGRMVDDRRATPAIATKLCEQEAAVLEIAEHAEVHRRRLVSIHSLARPLALGADHPLRRPPVDHGRNPQQDHERRIPRGVEQVGGDQQVDLLLMPREERRIVQRHHAARKRPERSAS